MSNKHMRILVMALVTLALGSIFMVACSRPGATSTTGSTGSGSSGQSGNSGGGNSSCPSGDTVKTNANNFEQACISLAKGTALKLVQDVQSFHIFANGQWVNGSPQPATESGAPTVSNVQMSGSSVNIGPFTTAGTFHIYCTVHPNMTLTIQVK